MMPEEKFSESFQWTLIGQLCLVASQFAIMSIISHVGKIEAVGLYGIISAFVSPFQLFFLMDAGKILIADNTKKIENASYHFFFFWTSISILLLSSVTVLIIYRDFSIVSLVIAFSLYRGIYNYKEFVYSLIQKANKTALVGKFMLMQGVIELIVFSCAYFFLESLGYSFFLTFVALVIFYLLYEVKLAKSKLSYNSNLLEFDYDLKVQRTIFKKCVPLGFSAFLGSLKLNIPRYFLEFVLGNRIALGQFTVFSQCVLAFGYINTAAGKSAISHLRKYFYSDFNFFLVFLKRITILSSLSVIGGVVFVAIGGVFFTRLFFGEEFIDGIYILYWLLITRIFIFPTTYLKTAQILLNQINQQLYIVILSSIIILLLSFFLSNLYSVKGLLYSLFICEAFVFVYTTLLVIGGVKKMKISKANSF